MIKLDLNWWSIPQDRAWAWAVIAGIFAALLIGCAIGHYWKALRLPDLNAPLPAIPKWVCLIVATCWVCLLSYMAAATWRGWVSSADYQKQFGKPMWSW